MTEETGENLHGCEAVTNGSPSSGIEVKGKARKKKEKKTLWPHACKTDILAVTDINSV